MSDIILLCLAICGTGITPHAAHTTLPMPLHARTDPAHSPASPTWMTPVPDKKIPAFLRAIKNPAEAGLVEAELLTT